MSDFATPDELSYDLALRAHAGTSFTPDVRAKQRQADYANYVNGVYAEMAELAKTDAQRAILEAEMVRYKQGYLKHFSALLVASSRIMSTMIAGPAKFPVARMEKRNATEQRRREELLAWRERAKQAVRSRILDARTQDEKADAEWEWLRRDIDHCLEMIARGERGEQVPARSVYSTSLAGKVERRAANGEVDLVVKATDLVKQFGETAKRPVFTTRHKFWRYVDLAKSRAAEVADSGEPETIAEAGGIKAVSNPGIGRVQIRFPGKPAPAVISSLKSEGWRWAPSESAWQRQLTHAAKASATRIVSAIGAHR